MEDIDLLELDDLGRAIILEKEFQQLRLEVSEFRGNLYLSIRWWFLDMEDNWLPTRKGITIPYTLGTVSNIFSALCDLLSEAEVLNEVVRYVEESNTGRSESLLRGESDTER